MAITTAFGVFSFYIYSSFPDVAVHRLLQYILDGGKSADEEIYEAQMFTFLHNGRASD
jgi:hypothetical protein